MTTNKKENKKNDIFLLDKNVGSSFLNFSLFSDK